MSRVFTLVTAAVAGLLVLGAMRACMDVKVKPYETRAGWPTRLDGEETTVHALDIKQARRLHPREPFFVVGYLLAPFDDSPRLCSRLEETGFCRNPSLLLDTSAVDLFKASALEEGCCSIGFWSQKPLVLRVQFRGRVARVLE